LKQITQSNRLFFRTYPLELSKISSAFESERYVFNEVVQPPTEPAYKMACELKRQGRIARPITEKSTEKKSAIDDDQLLEGLANCFKLNEDC